MNKIWSEGAMHKQKPSQGKLAEILSTWSSSKDSRNMSTKSRQRGDSDEGGHRSVLL